MNSLACRRFQPARAVPAAAPALLAVSSPAEREQVQQRIAREIGYLGEISNALSGRADAAG